MSHAATADQPDAWLVLYNANSADSIAWADFYAGVYGLPEENVLGLYAPREEHLYRWTDYWGYPGVQSAIVDPILDHFAAHPELESRVVGILLGYGLPSHYGAVPYGGEHGGLSIANALQDLHDNLYEGNPHCAGYLEELPPPLTRDVLQPGQYMVCQLDAPDLETAQRLTLQALALGSKYYGLAGQFVDYDFTDTQLPNDTWPALFDAVADDELADLPWREFVSDSGSGQPQSAFRFGTHRINWNSGAFTTNDPGAQVLAFNLNSFGAVSLRDPQALVFGTSVRGPYVPNALAGGYAAAIGATDEPLCCLAPFPEVLLKALRAGRTLGEAFYLSNPNDDWAWTCVGDPLLRVENWFDEAPITLPVEDANCDGVSDLYDAAAWALASQAPDVYAAIYPDCGVLVRGDMNCDGKIDSRDINGFVLALTSSAAYAAAFPDCDVLAGDMDVNGVVDSRDIDRFLSVSMPR